jgi:hypothetical protein
MHAQRMTVSAKSQRVGRRTFLAGASVGFTLLAGCDSGFDGDGSQGVRADLEQAAGKGVYVYRLSTRGRRAPKSLKAHAANRRYVSEAAAVADIPYHDAPVRVVRVVVHRDQAQQWFDGDDTVDLRHPPNKLGSRLLAFS